MATLMERHSYPGKLIVVEGIDGSGKSTQMRMLAEALRNSGFDLIVTCEPGGTALGRNLRAAFLETRETVAPMAELLSFAADRAQQQALGDPLPRQPRTARSHRQPHVDLLPPRRRAGDQ